MPLLPPSLPFPPKHQNQKTKSNFPLEYNALFFFLTSVHKKKSYECLAFVVFFYAEGLKSGGKRGG